MSAGTSSGYLDEEPRQRVAPTNMQEIRTKEKGGKQRRRLDSRRSGSGDDGGDGVTIARWKPTDDGAAATAVGDSTIGEKEAARGVNSEQSPHASRSSNTRCINGE
ncbi:hypothetical protein LINPERPRIM_LOCUS13106 [Linum perenne]